MALSQISGTTGIQDATVTSIKLADFAAAVDWVCADVGKFSNAQYV